MGSVSLGESSASGIRRVLNAPCLLNTANGRHSSRLTPRGQNPIGRRELPRSCPLRESMQAHVRTRGAAGSDHALARSDCRCEAERARHALPGPSGAPPAAPALATSAWVGGSPLFRVETEGSTGADSGPCPQGATVPKAPTRRAPSAARHGSRRAACAARQQRRRHEGQKFERPFEQPTQRVSWTLRMIAAPNTRSGRVTADQIAIAHCTCLLGGNAHAARVHALDGERQAWSTTSDPVPALARVFHQAKERTDRPKL